MHNYQGKKPPSICSQESSFQSCAFATSFINIMVCSTGFYKDTSAFHCLRLIYARYLVLKKINYVCVVLCVCLSRVHAPAHSTHTQSPRAFSQVIHTFAFVNMLWRELPQHAQNREWPPHTRKWSPRHYFSGTTGADGGWGKGQFLWNRIVRVPDFSFPERMQFSGSPSLWG